MEGVEKGKELRGSRKTSLKPGNGRVSSLDGEDLGSIGLGCMEVKFQVRC